MYKIFIVEDEEIIAKSIQKYLKSWGYQVKIVEDFHNVLEEILAFQADLLLLDLYLPFYNGYYWCEKIRRISTIPIVFLSSATDNMNIIMALSKGADDYIEKPFDLEVLASKIQAIFRRAYTLKEKNPLVYVGGIVFDLEKGQITKEDQRVELSKNEFLLFQLLYENKNKIVSREDLMLALWNTDSFVDDNTLTVNINRLRKKLELVGAEHLIKTKKGQGYLLEED